MKALVDVRRYPVSRRHPQFGRERLAAALHEAGIAYVHELDLGGHRDPHPDSPNTGLPEGAFRGYADHMATPAFAAALARVESRAREVARRSDVCGGRSAQVPPAPARGCARPPRLGRPAHPRARERSRSTLRRRARR